MIWYPLRGPSRSRARIAARTSPRPAFGPRDEPGGAGPQPPPLPAGAPRPLPPAFRPPEARLPRSAPPARAAPGGHPDDGAPDPAEQVAHTIEDIEEARIEVPGRRTRCWHPALPANRSRYDHDISPS